ncbi:beta-L-arabinofuranosidase domain-containing protein [uncultured Draconibacterium sp.]|uniref:glycoside hydrolase family 127 protein n=1 Tax=uncultured Draconibacterium sp. TaxID=1573823 RepID=UPI0032168D14
MKTILRLFAAFTLLIALFSCAEKERQNTPLQPVSFTDVHLNDCFWAPKIEVNQKVSIPSAFQKSEETGRVDNFALAAGLIEGEHQGDFPFDDTDIYKILEGASYALAAEYDEKLDHYLDSLITYISAAQEEDGYLYTCLTNKCERLQRWYGNGRWDRLNSHELYNSGHLYEAAVAHYQATGKTSLLNVAIKNADLVYKDFGPNEGQKHVPSGHPIIEMALVKLYRATGDKKYLELARYFIDETGKGTDGHELNAYSQDHMPIVEQEEAVGHAVRLGYLYSGVTDVASLMQDDSLMMATKRVWDNVVSKKLYITGGIGQRAQGEGFGPNYKLPNMTSYCETCAAISNVYWNYRLFLNDADAKYYDVLERTLYNGLISGVSLSGDLFFYDNPLESVHNHERAPWFGCACCPGNVTRFMASVPGYVYAAGENSLFVNLFAEGVAEISVGENKVKITQETRYPWEGTVKLKMEEAPVGKFALMVRIPGWAQNQVVPSDLYRFVSSDSEKYSLKVNGVVVESNLKKGYVEINRNWKNNDVVELVLPMPVRKVVANEKVENDKGKVALQRGPVVYCLEDKDNNNDWLFDNYIDANTAVESRYEADLLGGVVTLSLEGNKVEGEKEQSTTLKAIPYYTWNNRGKSNMLVWIPAEKSTTVTKPASSVLDLAEAKASTDWAPGLDDGFDPKSSDDTDKAYFYWWLKEGAEDWVEYDFEKPVTLSESSVYWLNLDHYDVNYRAPENWNLQYLNSKGTWADVETSDAFGVALNAYNTVNFKPVKTKAIRLNAKQQEGFSAGIMEWKLK